MTITIQCAQYNWTLGVPPTMSSQGKHSSLREDRINELEARTIEFIQHKQHIEK